jgi:hypothetical protein
MRRLVFAIALAAASLALPSANPAARAQDAATIAAPQIALNDARGLADDTRAGTRANASTRTAQFCGQCTADSHCGVGHKCCPMKGCPASRPKGCFAVTTCP